VREIDGEFVRVAEERDSCHEEEYFEEEEEFFFNICKTFARGSAQLRVERIGVSKVLKVMEEERDAHGETAGGWRKRKVVRDEDDAAEDGGVAAEEAVRDESGGDGRVVERSGGEVGDVESFVVRYHDRE
tara:strand:- start:1114 stop:1503 length:390 start_codon:yes stop_codon:yes gene_type:complete